jgi:predicted DNA-binding antitoxin AbrB/MazE fold protein
MNTIKTNLILVINMGPRIKAMYEEGILKPLEKLDLKEGEEVEIEVKKSPVERLEGMIRISNRRWVKELIESPDLEPI